MNTRLLRRQTAALLRGHKLEGAAVLSSCLVVWLFVLCTELLLRSLLMRAGIGDGLLYAVLPLIRYAVGTLLMTPFLLGALWWLVQTANGEANTPGTVLKIYCSRQLLLRGGKLLLTLAAIAAITLLPVIISGWGAVYLLRLTIEQPQDSVRLFAASQLVMLTLAAVVWRWRLLCRLLPAAFLFMESPLQPVSRLLMRSRRLMDGRQGILFRILLSEALRPSPFLITRIGVATAVFLKTARIQENL